MKATRILIDTGPIVAMLYDREEHHLRCLEQAQKLPATLYTCWPVITEAAYLLRSSADGVRALLHSLRDGRLQILELTPHDVDAIVEVLGKYRDQAFDFADVCLMHLAQRERITGIFTLDRRHFSVFRTETGDSLEIVP